MKPILFRVKEEILNGINYRLNDWTKTAEVTEKSGGYEGDIIIPETVMFNDVQTLKAYSPILVTLSGSVIEVSFLQPSKA